MANQTFDPSLLQQTVTVNKDADAYASPAPPPEGEYLVVIKGPKKEEDFIQFRVNKDEAGNPVSVVAVFKIHGEIVDPGGKNDGLVLFPHIFVQPSTKYQERSGTTTALSFIKRAGFDHLIQSTDLSVQEQMDLMKQVVAAHPQMRVKAKWRLSVKGKNADGTDKYEDIYKSMSEFPDDPNNPGQKLWKVPVDPLNPQGDMAEARCEITEFLGN